MKLLLTLLPMKVSFETETSIISHISFRQMWHNSFRQLDCSSPSQYFEISENYSCALILLWKYCFFINALTCSKVIFHDFTILIWNFCKEVESYFILMFFIVHSSYHWNSIFYLCVIYDLSLCCYFILKLWHLFHKLKK